MADKYGTLYLVGTPIGNLEDITYRAVRTLSEVDLIAAEDTRRSLQLLNHLKIKKPLISYHDNNRISRAKELVEKLKEGQSIALISDAGMPGISDPGEELVALAISEGIFVTSAPGCTAVVTALVLSGISTGRFAFEGFLPQKQKDRVKFLESIKYEERTIVFYEGPHRVKKTLRDILDIFGDRQCSVLRELTKLHEEAIRGALSEVLEHFAANEPRGEFVIVVEGSQKKVSDNPKPDFTNYTLEEHVKYYMEQGYERMDAMKLTAKDKGLSKRDVYGLLNS
ncbi:MAG: 16S rRNA (cytidine(1402)-2'-O)-methyltransferase [Acetivibrionales bacterium]|mgnify:CR=1 FL=1|jgi:16S rRNA (cytidine1402-2'-O)-methyltransferase|nr:16S rRNA (cytidine(1402)-2'-O)-methyltransferase [Clostridiaceae bacterium]